MTTTPHTVLCLVVVLGCLPGLPGRAQTTATPAPGAERVLTPAEQKAADLRLPSLDRTSFKPDAREPVLVPEDEDSRFGTGQAARDRMTVKDPITEEKRLRDLLDLLKPQGHSVRNGVHRVLLLGMILEEGSELPKMYADQAERLLVRSVTDREVLLQFVESDPDREPRTVRLNYDLAPRVLSLLPGELLRKVVPADGDGRWSLSPLPPTSMLPAIDGLKDADLQGMVERRRELFNAPAVPPGASQDESDEP
jgi:hypothetical protein